MLKTLAVSLMCCGLAAAAPTVSLFYDPSQPAVSFAAAEIHKAYAKRGETLVEHGLQSVSKP